MPSGDKIYYMTPARIIAEVFRAAPTVLYLILFDTSNSNAIEYALLFDRADLPDPGDPPLLAVKLFKTGYAFYQPSEGERRFDYGLTVALSTTAEIYTASLAASLLYMIEGREP
jgi:hypothetical protein